MHRAEGAEGARGPKKTSYVLFRRFVFGATETAADGCAVQLCTCAEVGADESWGLSPSTGTMGEESPLLACVGSAVQTIGVAFACYRAK